MFKSGKDRANSNTAKVYNAKDNVNDTELICLDMASHNRHVNIYQLVELTVDGVLVLLGPGPISHVITEALTTFEDATSANSHPYIWVITMSSAAQASRHWILDSGATAHITSDMLQFTCYKQIAPIPIRGFGSQMTASAIDCSTIVLPFKLNGSKIKIIFQHILHVPEAAENMILVAQLMAAGLNMNGKTKEVRIYLGKQLSARATLLNRQFVLQTDPDPIMAAS